MQVVSAKKAGEKSPSGAARGAEVNSFQFERDTFTFANELVWQYQFDAGTGRVTTFCTDPPPAYSHRCFVMVRSARQFFYHARFDPTQSLADERNYRRLIREVVGRNPRRPSLTEDRVTIPGYDCLRAFSHAQTRLLKEECGGPWQSYFLRSHWRMVMPVWRGQQEKMSRQLVKSFRMRLAPIVHLFRFPQVTINHGLVLFGCRDSETGIEFDAYDPNIPEHPVKLVFDRAQRTFIFPRAKYWGGGPLQVIEIYRGGLY